MDESSSVTPSPQLSQYQALCRLCLSKCENFTRFLPDPQIKQQIQEAIYSLHVSLASFLQFLHR